jgi:hypothetical protein
MQTPEASLEALAKLRATIPKVYIPTTGPDDWQRFLADSAKQWRTGFSAKTLAYCWECANGGLPNEIASMLRPYGGEVELLLAIPEYRVALPGASRGESQSDIFALARAGHRTFAITVEGKVNEPFSETVGDWLQTASDGQRERLAFMCDLLGLTLPLPDHIHYKLLHRTASAVVEARRFKTDAAAMIVHSFSRERMRFGDFAQFASLFDTPKEITVADRLVAVRANARPPLYLGWACGDCRFLSA